MLQSNHSPKTKPLSDQCSNNSTQTIFTTYRSRIFRSSKLATFTTQNPFPQTEALFLILAMQAENGDEEIGG